MIPLEPQHAAAAYEFLRTLPPFARWKLPPAEEVEFRIRERQDIYGEYSKWLHNGVHLIVVSSARVGYPATLLQVVAHEMIHLRQDREGTDTRTQHNARFKRLAASVCRYHGFDPKAF